MELLIVVLVIALAVAAASRWGVDSRDYADWRPSDAGLRRSPWEG